jgi:RNA-binding protein
LITSKMKRHIRHELSAEGPTVWIGKEGLTAQIVKEISRQLDQREMIKAKFLQTALKDTSAREIAVQIAKETESTLVEVRGHTFMLYRRKRKKT